MTFDWHRARSRLLARPFAARLLAHRRLWFENGARSWAEALARSGGYGDTAILLRVASATRDVVDGRAGMERDGVTITPRVRDPAVELALTKVVGLVDEPLRVVDFGGALGGTYLRHREAWGDRIGLWVVVEQPAWLSTGRSIFPRGEVTFSSDLSTAIADVRPHLVILGGSLQCVADPDEVTALVKASKARCVVIGRTPVHDGSGRQLVIEHVPPTIGRASYPMWIFEREWLEAFCSDWEVVLDQLAVGGAMFTSSGVPFRWIDRVIVRPA